MIVGKKSFLPLVRVGSIRRTCRHSGLEQKESVQRNRPTVNREIFRFMNCKNIEEVRDCLIALRAELDVKETALETYKKRCEEAIKSAPAAQGKTEEHREESSSLEDGIDVSPARAREKARKSISGVTERIKADLTTSILNNADKERWRRSYDALCWRLLQKETVRRWKLRRDSP
jgi:hypothetical protein